MKQIVFLVFMFLQVVGYSQVEEVLFRNEKGQIEQKGHLSNNLITPESISICCSKKLMPINT